MNWKTYHRCVVAMFSTMTVLVVGYTLFVVLTK